MGGRGSSSGDGPALGNGGNQNINIVSETDVWSYRHRQGNEPFVDAINSGVRTIEDDFPGLMADVNTVAAATLGGANKRNILGYYSRGDKTIALNNNYTDVDKMNSVYDRSVRTGFHPSRGGKTGTEAVALHETGHALNDHIAQKMGVDMDTAAQNIVNSAYASSNGRGGTKAWAGGISKYAQQSNTECIAEAVADWYCNGSNSSAQSKAIMSELRRYV